MNIRLPYIHCAMAALTLAAGCQSAPVMTQNLHVYSVPDGVTAALPSGQTCNTPCVLTVESAKIEPVTFTKPGCLTMMQMSIPELIDSKGSLTDAHNYTLSPNPLMPQMVCK